MPKEFRYIGPGPTADAVNDIAGAITAVKKVNGHEPDDAEIRDLLEAQGAESNELRIEAVRTAVDC